MMPMCHQHFTHDHVLGALKQLHIAVGYSLSVAGMKRLAGKAPFQLLPIVFPRYLWKVETCVAQMINLL